MRFKTELFIVPDFLTKNVKRSGMCVTELSEKEK